MTNGLTIGAPGAPGNRFATGAPYCTRSASSPCARIVAMIDSTCAVPRVCTTNSICTFSGQNDTPNEPLPEGGRVQSYGQLVKQGLKGAVPSPGTACRGGSN